MKILQYVEKKYCWLTSIFTHSQILKKKLNVIIRNNDIAYFFNTFCNKTWFCFLLPNVECPLGYFGKGCTEHCSGHCIKGEPCDHISGECTNGCQDGYTGVRCSDCKKMK